MAFNVTNMFNFFNSLIKSYNGERSLQSSNKKLSYHIVLGNRNMLNLTKCYLEQKQNFPSTDSCPIRQTHFHEAFSSQAKNSMIN